MGRSRGHRALRRRTPTPSCARSATASRRGPCSTSLRSSSVTATSYGDHAPGLRRSGPRPARQPRRQPRPRRGRSARSARRRHGPRSDRPSTWISRTRRPTPRRTSRPPSVTTPESTRGSSIRCSRGRIPGAPSSTRTPPWRGWTSGRVTWNRWPATLDFIALNMYSRAIVAADPADNASGRGSPGPGRRTSFGGRSGPPALHRLVTRVRRATTDTRRSTSPRTAVPSRPRPDPMARPRCGPGRLPGGSHRPARPRDRRRLRRARLLRVVPPRQLRVGGRLHAEVRVVWVDFEHDLRRIVKDSGWWLRTSSPVHHWSTTTPWTDRRRFSRETGSAHDRSGQSSKSRDVGLTRGRGVGVADASQHGLTGFPVCEPAGVRRKHQRLGCLRPILPTDGCHLASGRRSGHPTTFAPSGLACATRVTGRLRSHREG